MNIISWNVNGIRAVERKGELQKLLEDYNPDVLLIQEIKAKPEQLSKFLTEHEAYHQFYHPAEKPGYAGTGIWVKKSYGSSTHQPTNSAPQFSSGMPEFQDTEGRIARVDLGDWSIFGVYFPNGGKSPEAWDDKLVFYEKFLQYMNQLRDEGRHVIWGGDVNCAHEEIDLARPKDNLKSIGFLPEERAWVTKVIEHNWLDIFRHLNPEEIIYSWWHVISRARLRNVGWRIDYFFVDEALLPQVQEIKYLNAQMGSDHCPVQLVTV